MTSFFRVLWGVKKAHRWCLVSFIGVAFPNYALKSAGFTSP